MRLQLQELTVLSLQIIYMNNNRSQIRYFAQQTILRNEVYFDMLPNGSILFL